MQSPATVAVWSGSQSSIVNVFDTMRVPGLRSRIFGRSRRLMSGSRNIVITVACEKSLSNEVGLGERRAGRHAGRRPAFRCDSATMSGLYSMPCARGAALGGRDHRPAVAGSEIDHVILRRDLRHVEHLVDERLRRRHPDDVLARLSD